MWIRDVMCIRVKRIPQFIRTEILTEILIFRNHFECLVRIKLLVNNIHVIIVVVWCSMLRQPFVVQFLCGFHRSLFDLIDIISDNGHNQHILFQNCLCKFSAKFHIRDDKDCFLMISLLLYLSGIYFHAKCVTILLYIFSSLFISSIPFFIFVTSHSM